MVFPILYGYKLNISNQCFEKGRQKSTHFPQYRHDLHDQAAPNTWQHAHIQGVQKGSRTKLIIITPCILANGYNGILILLENNY